MDPVTIAAIVAAAASATGTLVMFVVKHYIGGMLGEFDRKRDEARKASAEQREQARMQQEAIAKGMRALLRAKLIEGHARWCDAGYCPSYAKEEVEKTYMSYHELGGNGVGTALYEEIMALPSKPREQRS